MLWCSDISISSYRLAHTLSIYYGHRLHRSTFQCSRKDGLQNEKRKEAFPFCSRWCLHVHYERKRCAPCQRRAIVMSLSMCVAVKWIRTNIDIVMERQTNICRISGSHSGVRNSSIFWDIALCSPLKINRRSGGTSVATCFTLASCLGYSLRLKMEEPFSTEMSVGFERTTRRCIPWDKTLDILCFDEWPRFLLNHSHAPVTTRKWMDIREIYNFCHGLVCVKRIRETWVQAYLETDHP